MLSSSIRLRYLDGDQTMAALQYAVRRPNQNELLKWKLLAKLGIARDTTLTPVQTWLREMCDLNGLPFGHPLPAVLVEAIKANVHAARFLLFLGGGR